MLKITVFAREDEHTTYSSELVQLMKLVGACSYQAGTSGNTVKLKRLGLAEDCNMADKVAEESKVGRFFQPFKNCFYRLRYL